MTVGGYRVLLVEQEEGASDAIVNMLRGAGLTVDDVRRSDARSVLTQGHHDLLLIDLAGHAGWDFLEEIQGLDGLPPVVLISAHGSDSRARPYRKRVAAYLYRPVSSGEILGTCERVLTLARRSEAFEGERRRHQRRRLLARVTLAAGGGEGIPGTLLDVSQHGFQAELPGSTSPGQPGDLVRVSVLSGAEPQTLTGRIRWWRALPTGVLLGAETEG